MCGLANGATIPARAYLSDAKRLDAHLKGLKSVSRDYRRMRVRELKEDAARKEYQRERMKNLRRYGSQSQQVERPERERRLSDDERRRLDWARVGCDGAGFPISVAEAHKIIDSILPPTAEEYA